jgi:hypothetical protein
VGADQHAEDLEREQPASSPASRNDAVRLYASGVSVIFSTVFTTSPFWDH